MTAGTGAVEDAATLELGIAGEAAEDFGGAGARAGDW